MILLIIRHGESEADILNVHEGRADFPLTERGHKQAQAMAEYVKEHFKVDRIYASPLKRAAQAAQHLSDEVNVDIVFDDELMEFNNGLLAGLSYAEADKKYPEVKDLPEDQAVYGQESKREFRARADRMLAKIRSEAADDETVAVVTHGGMINQLYRSMLGLPVVCDVFFGTFDTGIHVWKIKNNTVFVIRANMDGHTEGI